MHVELEQAENEPMIAYIAYLFPYNQQLAKYPMHNNNIIVCTYVCVCVLHQIHLKWQNTSTTVYPTFIITVTIGVWHVPAT